MDVEAAIVNYATPQLTRRAAWSLVSLYPDLEITLFDNGSPDESVSLLTEEFARVGTLRIREGNANIHHGPAMNLAVSEARRSWILLFDSDCVAFRSGFLEKMMDSARLYDAYMVGEVCFVDDAGFNVSSDGHRYVHPKCALVRRDIYVTLPPFERHGAPCLANQIAAVESGFALVHFPVDDYVFHLGRGTVKTHGYGLGLRSALTSAWRKLRGAGIVR